MVKKIILGIVLLLGSSVFIIVEKSHQSVIDNNIDNLISDISYERDLTESIKNEEITLKESISKSQDNNKVKEYNIWIKQNQLLEDLLK